MSNGTNYPDDRHAKLVCLIGQGAKCCRYLTVTGRGWSCEKHSTLKALLDKRVADRTMTALGDNCEGKDPRR